MGSGASIPAETELSTFKEMQAKFEVLKTEGKTDEDIYAELKILYNTSASAASSNGDIEKPAVVADATAAPTAEAAPPAGDETGVEATATAVVEHVQGEAAQTVAAETSAAEAPAVAEKAPVEAAATTG